MPNIHPSAIVHPDARISESATIMQFATVDGDVFIDDGTVIGPHCLIADGARIGKNCQIHQGAVVSHVPQDLKFHGEYSEFFIGDHTVVREFCTLHRGTDQAQKTVIGKHCLLMAYVHVAHDVIMGDHVICANAVQLGGHVTVDDWAIVGGISAAHQFTRIGAHAMIGLQSTISKDVPPYSLAAKSPLQFEGLNIIGLRRRGFASESIDRLRALYKLIYFSGYNVSQALEQAKETFEPTPEILTVLDFIAASKRGIIRGASNAVPGE